MKVKDTVWAGRYTKVIDLNVKSLLVLRAEDTGQAEVSASWSETIWNDEHPDVRTTERHRSKKLSGTGGNLYARVLSKPDRYLLSHALSLD